ncbi:MAG: hypothetical protein KBD55_00475 [Candidatus Pacebacteria bacterium]|nr:hypothetical protein [Candidatus Paceibacterota bacterium]
MGISFDVTSILITIAVLLGIVGIRKILRDEFASNMQQGGAPPQGAQFSQPPETKESDVLGRKEDEILMSDIAQATSVQNLMDIAESKIFFNHEQSAAFLEKIRPYDDVLDVDDWLTIYTVAELGSELEKLSHQRLKVLMDEE